MRIASVLVAVAASLSIALTGCGGTSEVEEIPASETVLAEEQVSTETDTVTAMAICALKWTCYDGKYYSTETQCITACGGAICERDYACNGTCVCP